MAQLAIALAGAGAASFGVSSGILASSYLGMSTVGIGWSIGSMVGSMMNKQGGQDAQGPRLADKSVQGSSYGVVYSNHLWFNARCWKYYLGNKSS